MSDFCNLGCLYCSGSTTHNYKNSWSRGILIKILDSAVKLGVQEISLTSLVGEPTLFKDIKFLMEEIEQRNFLGTILTNGALLDLEFARFMQRIHWDVLILSLDSFNPDIQYKLRPGFKKKDYLEKIIEFLEYTVKKNPQLNVNLNMVVNKMNYNDIHNYFKRAESYGVKNITLLKLTRMTDNYEKFVLTNSQLVEFKNMLKNIDTPIYFNSLEWLGEHHTASNGFELDIVKTEDNGKRHCYFHLCKVLIDCDGQVLKCNGNPQKTRFNVNEDDLCNIYYDVVETYKDLRTDARCWDICCSPIKALNQEIDYYLEKDIVESKDGIHINGR